MRTRRRPGRVGKRGEGRAGRAGRAWERPPPPPAFERATQGARRRFKSKRPAACPPLRARAAGGARGRRGGRCGTPRPPGAAGRGGVGEDGEGPRLNGPGAAPRCPPPTGARRQALRPQAAGPESKPRGLRSEPARTRHPLTSGLPPLSSRSRGRGAPKTSPKRVPLRLGGGGGAW